MIPTEKTFGLYEVSFLSSSIQIERGQKTEWCDAWIRAIYLFICIGVARSSTGSHFMQNECVATSRKRKRHEPKEKQHTQMETLYHSSYQAKEPQSVSSPKEQERHQANPCHTHTCSYKQSKRKKREE